MVSTPGINFSTAQREEAVMRPIFEAEVEARRGGGGNNTVEFQVAQTEQSSGLICYTATMRLSLHCTGCCKTSESLSTSRAEK